VKVGDLVKFAPLWAHDRRIKFGLVVRVEKDFYRDSTPHYSSDRVEVVWDNGEWTHEPKNALEILKKS
jgi:hypothetical protein